MNIPGSLLLLIFVVGGPLYLIMEHGYIVLTVFLILLALFVFLIIYSLYKTKNAYKPQEIGEELNRIDSMSGFDFEYYIASLLRRLGYKNVRVTKASGDYGADILAVYEHVTYAFQCKRYSKNIGLKPIQEIYAAKRHYHCDKAVVVTNMRFSQNARKLAKDTEVELWDRDVLSSKISSIITSIEQNN